MVRASWSEPLQSLVNHATSLLRKELVHLGAEQRREAPDMTTPCSVPWWSRAVASVVCSVATHCVGVTGRTLAGGQWPPQAALHAGSAGGRGQLSLVAAELGAGLLLTPGSRRGSLARCREPRMCEPVGARLGCRRADECFERLTRCRRQCCPRPALLLPATPALPREDLGRGPGEAASWRSSRGCPARALRRTGSGRGAV